MQPNYQPQHIKLHLWKERIHLLFPPEVGRAAEASQSLFSHTDGMGIVRMGAEGRW
jgi:hypothetical protein